MATGSTKGFSRDRTQAYASLRQRAHAHKHAFEERDSARLLGVESGNGGLSGVDSITASVMPAWVETQEQITTDIAIIKQKLGELSRIHKKATLPTFDDAGDGNEQVIEVMTREITSLFRRAEQRLKSLRSRGASADGGEKVVTNVQQSLAAELQKLSQDFRKQQKTYLNRLRKQQEVVSTGSAAFGGNFSLLGDDDDGGDFDAGFTESQILKSKENESMVLEREKDIAAIVRSVEELATVRATDAAITRLHSAFASWC